LLAIFKHDIAMEFENIDDSIFPDRELPLTVMYANTCNNRMHTHSFTELVVILEGSGEHLLVGGSYPIYPGTVFIIPPTAAHGYRSERGFRLANILFREDFFIRRFPELTGLPSYQAFVRLEPNARKLAGVASRLTMNPPQLEETAARIASLSDELAACKEGRIPAASGAFACLLVELCRFYAGKSESAAASVMGVGKIVSYLEHHYREAIDLGTLAEIGAVSERSMLRHFKSCTGKTPIAYLLEVRVERAKDMLRETRLDITEIAFRAGFGDSNYFARVFRRLVGESPRAYRNSHPRSSGESSDRNSA
jgi:AraC-like DNA-binding protein